MGNEYSTGGGGGPETGPRRKDREAGPSPAISGAPGPDGLESKPLPPYVTSGGSASPGGAGSGAGGGPGGAPPEPDVTSEATEVLIDARFGRSKGLKANIEDFELLKVLGKGSFGKVMLVQKKDDKKQYALKTLRKETLLKRNQVAHTKTERSVLQAVDHPFIVKLMYAFQTRDKLYIVTDYCPGGELFFWLKRDRVFSQARVRLYAAELILALEHLHKLDIVYRDLKPENILLDADGHIKLTDFGLSKEAVTGFGREGGTKTFCGTPEYLAPEILENEGHGKAVDWWSLGTLLYEMCAGLPPFYDTNMEIMYEKIMTADLVFPRHFLPETRSLLSGMLNRDVTKRLGYNGAEELKAHPFFAGLDWEKVMRREIKPMFKPPPSTSETDVRNFEEEFTRETPVDSVDERGYGLSATQAERTHFDDFTFVADSGLGRSTGSGTGGLGAAGGGAAVGSGAGGAGTDSFGPEGGLGGGGH